MNFKCQKLTSFDTGVTRFIGQNVIHETIPVTLRSVKFESMTTHRQTTGRHDVSPTVFFHRQPTHQHDH